MINAKLIKRLFLLVTILVTVFFQTVPARAFNNFYSDSEIQFFDPNACDPNGSAPPDTSAPASGSAPLKDGVAFDDSQSSDTGKQTTIDDDGIDPSPTGSGSHQRSTSYADGKLGALHTNYFALNPGWAQAHGLALGDVAALTYKGKTIYAVYGDNHVGNTVHAEISVKAAMALSGATNPAKVDSLTGVHTIVYPKTHQQLNGSVDQNKIDQIGAQASGGGSPAATSTPTPSGGQASSAPASNCTCPSDNGSTTISGKDNEEKTWNFFKGKGLSDKQVAGIMGNLTQESHFDPQIRQNGGRSKDPNTAGGGGYGLIQWTPGAKIIGLAKDANVRGPIYELATQLELVWQHMHNHPVVTQPFDLNHFKMIDDEVEAGKYFGSQIEGFGIAGDRFAFATDALHKFGGKGGGSTSTDPTGDSSGSGCNVGNAGTPDCASAENNAKILCEAKKYDPVNYVWGGGHAGGAAYHKACSDIKPGETCGLDCTGLISVAIFDAFGGSGTLSWDTNSLRADSANWKEVSFNKLQPGDVIEPDAGHAEIVDHVTGSRISTFGAHSATYPQPKQVGPSSYSDSGTNKYYHYVGKGSQ